MAPIDADTQTQLLDILKDRHRARRFLGLGARPELLFDVLSRIDNLAEWHREFVALADQFDRAGDKAEDPAVKRDNWLSACLYFHLACLGVFEDNENRVGAYRAMVSTYGKARELFRIPAQLVEYSFANTNFTAYLRCSAGIEPTPCAVLLRGQDASREVELHTISDFLLERGLSTLAIDAAGQGVSRLSGLRMPDGLAASVGAAIDALKDCSGVDLERLAIVGQSLGGHLAVRVAAEEPRFKACVTMGGFYSMSDFRRGLLPEYNARLNYGEGPRPKLSLDGLINNVTCHLFALNGSEDAVIPPSQTVKIFETAKSALTRKLKLYDGAPHTAYYDNKTILFDIADWINEVLA